MPDLNPNDNLLTPEAVAKILAVSRPYIYKMVATGLLEGVRWGSDEKRRVVRIRQSEVWKFIQEHSTSKVS